ncbi:MAG: aminoacyl-tRNA hydrolase [Cellvibrionales bacterium]|nr:aminoacyl-tRNA hydrolase [Cellvibrionales bacterium]MDG2472807.1 alternative ribosome rescue aminoacyl-tRNA hydrolase ArfB [Pseudomonadales bacterium]HCH20447.1 aminoacyl-tRNA hydrolase [Cellvibrionales bacterium]
MLRITAALSIAESEIDFSAIRAQGSGGQNVNKVSTAIHLRFDIKASSLAEQYQRKLLRANDQRINKQGVIIIKAQSFRSQEKNRADAIDRLLQTIRDILTEKKPRFATKPSKTSQRKRVDTKTQRGKTKSLRGKVLE